MAIIFIDQLAVAANIGVYEHEKQQAQPLLIDLQCNWEISQAAETDDVAFTMDYDKLVEQINNVINKQHYNLIETLAEVIADTLQETFALRWLQLKISKPQAIANAIAAGVVVERGKKRK